MKRVKWYLLLFSQISIIIGFWMWNHINHPLGNLLNGDVSGQFLAYGRLAGLLAAFGILFQIILIGRVKWVERVFGLDRLTHLHHIVGFSLVVLLPFHIILLTLGHSMQAGVTQFEQFADFCKNWPKILSALIGLLMMLAAIWFSVLIVFKRIGYECWYFTHITFYIAIALVFGHQLVTGSDFTDNRYFAIYWQVLYIFTFVNLIIFRIIRPLVFTFSHKFYVSRLVSESSDVVSVYIEGKNMDTFKIEAGQFMIVRFWAPGFKLEAHPFSMSCFPDGKKIRLSIKALGDFTKKIPRLKSGTPVYIDGPHGVFTADNVQAKKVLLIAGGIGITPIRSLAEDFLCRKKDVIIIYGNRNQSLMVFAKELDELVDKSEGLLKVYPVMSMDPEWRGEKGNIDLERIKRLVSDVSEREIFLCGPPPMMKMIKTVLLKMKVKISKIHYERFAL